MGHNHRLDLMLGRLFTSYDSNQSKLSFRHSLARLHSESIPPTDTSYWSQFYETCTWASEVASLIPADVIRAAVVNRPDNVACLVATLANKVFQLLQDPAFPAHPSSSSWIPSMTTNETAKEMLNCLRVLTRIWPLVFEAGQPEWIQQLLWSRQPAETESQQFVIEDDDPDTSFVSNASEASDKDLPPSLGITAAVDLLFVCDFTLPPPPSTQGKRPRKVQYLTWQPGVGSSASLSGTTKTHLSNRTEVLRFLISLVSSTMFSSPNRFLSTLLKTKERKPALALLCSLLNTRFAKNQQGLFVSSTQALNKIQVMATGQREIDEQASALPHLCLSLLDILLVPHDTPAPTDARPNTDFLSPTVERSSLSFSTQSKPAIDNIFRYYLAKVHQPSDFKFLIDGAINALAASTADASTPSLLLSVSASISGWSGITSSKNPDAQEVLVYLWKMTECNKNFLTALIQDERCPELVMLLLNFCLDLKDDPASVGLIRLCSFFLQCLSAERGFGNRLNVPLAAVMAPKTHVVNGSNRVIDFLVTSVYTLVFSAQGLSSIYPSFVLIISNSSPYIKGLSLVAATKLLQLFLAFSAPAFILAEEGNPRLVYYLVEAFNNVIHYQLSDNSQLVYAIIRSHRRFEQLANFTLKSAVEDIRRARVERSNSSVIFTAEPEAANTVPVRPELKHNLSSISLHSLGEEKSTDESDPVRMSEKARGKMRERDPSLDEYPGDPGAPGPYRSRSGFTPTENWVSSWREHLPLDSILILLAELRPKVSSLCSVASRQMDQAVIDFLKSVTLIDVLPPAPPLKLRKFQHSPYSLRWLSSLVWSSVYVSNPAIFVGIHVKLFAVQQSAPKDVVSEATEALGRVGNAVMQRLPSGTMGGGPRRPSVSV